MKTLLMMIVFGLLVGCAAKEPKRYNSVEEYTNATNSTAEIGTWESPAYKKQKNDKLKSEVADWVEVIIFSIPDFIH